MRLFSSGFASLLLVYLVWGSSFLAIRLALHGDGAFPPYLLAGLRTALAGVLLCAWSIFFRSGARVSWPQLRWLAGTGALLWVGGHTLVILAERELPSGISALLFASSPIWAVILQMLARRRFEAVLAAPVLAGCIGLALVVPLEQSAEAPIPLLPAGLLLLSALFWALGSLLGSGPAASLPLSLTAGLQLFCAGALNLLIAVLSGERMPLPGPVPAAAAVYLTLAGTVLAYLAYAHCQRVLPISWLMSFAYVNPVIAVLLGWVISGETVSGRTVAGMLVVTASLLWLFSGRSPETGSVL